MELRHRRYFVAVAEELRPRRRSERLHIAQPAGHNVSPTAAGVVMLEDARRASRRPDTAVHAARTARVRAIGRLRVGYMPDSVPRYVPQSFARFAASAPGIELMLETGSPERLAADVRDGSLDVAVVCLPLASHGLRVTPLGEERGVIALPAAHPLSAAYAIDPRQIARSPHVMLPRSSNPAFHDGVISAWRAAGLTADPREASEPQVEHVLLAVAAGAGLAVLPASVAERFSVPGVRFVPLSGSLGCEIAVLSRDEDSTMVAGYLRHARALAHPEPPMTGAPTRRAELSLAG